jgi:hypothetical protein
MAAEFLRLFRAGDNFIVHALFNTSADLVDNA